MKAALQKANCERQHKRFSKWCQQPATAKAWELTTVQRWQTDSKLKS